MNSSSRRRRIFVPLCLALLVVALFAVRASVQASTPLAPAAQPASDQARTASLLAAYDKLPLYFVENRGQIDPRVVYYLQGSDKAIYFTSGGLTFALTGSGAKESASELLMSPDGAPRRFGTVRAAQRWAIKLDFVDANPSVQRPEPAAHS